MSPTTQVSSSDLEVLSKWDRLGLIIRPNDTLESYSSHAERAALMAKESDECSARKRLWSLYRIDPSWVKVSYSNKGLYPWEAGCTWFSDNPDEAPEVQLKEAFLRSSNYLGLYHKDEVLAHEYVHAVRAPLGSSIFEEIFSYLISLHFAQGKASYVLRLFRTALGPLFSSPKESCFFLFVLILAPFLGFAGWAIPALFGARLLFRWWQWLRCKRQLEALYGDMALALMVRLTDKEIVQMSRMQPFMIAGWIDQESERSFRWRYISLALTGKIWQLPN